MLDVGEAVLRGDPCGPALDRRVLDLDGAPAGAADQVVVVRAAAAPVDRLAVVGAQHVDLAVVGQGLQAAVDGGQPDRVAARRAAGVQVLGAAEVVELVEELRGTAVRCRVGRRASPRSARAVMPHRSWRRAVGVRASVLVVVDAALVRRVPVAVVDVVDVVARAARPGARSRAVLVRVLVHVGAPPVPARAARRAAPPRRRRRGTPRWRAARSSRRTACPA